MSCLFYFCEMCLKSNYVKHIQTLVIRHNLTKGLHQTFILALKNTDYD